MMNDKLYNLIHDPNVDFYLAATPKLKELIVANEHPHIKKLRTDAKAELLAGNVLVLDKQDIYKLAKGTLEPEGTFLLSTGDVRVVGTPNIKVSGNEKGT